jgi:hypothetical protein
MTATAGSCGKTIKVARNAARDMAANVAVIKKLLAVKDAQVSVVFAIGWQWRLAEIWQHWSYNTKPFFLKTEIFRTRIPVSNTVTALEVWLLACMLLVFLTLMEYAVILRKIVLFRRYLPKKPN